TGGSRAVSFRHRERAQAPTLDEGHRKMPFGFKFQGEADETPALVRTSVGRNRRRWGRGDLDRSRGIVAGVSYTDGFSASRYRGCGGIGRQRWHRRRKQAGRFPSTAIRDHYADRITKAKQQVGSELLPQPAGGRPERANIEFL